MLEVYYRVMFRLLKDGWPEGMDLDEAIVSDPEYAQQVAHRTPQPATAAREIARSDQAKAWASDLLRRET